jgi:hypothetical protein
MARTYLVQRKRKRYFDKNERSLRLRGGLVTEMKAQEQEGSLGNEERASSGASAHFEKAESLGLAR